MNFEVLIVDDDKMVLYFHKILVRESGLSENPLVFMDGREALDYLLEEKNPDKVYCVLLDINMPVMDGWTFLEKIGKLAVGDRVLAVMITSSIDTADKRKAAGYPLVIDYLEKPITLEALKRIKKNLLLDRLFGRS